MLSAARSIAPSKRTLPREPGSERYSRDALERRAIAAAAHWIGVARAARPDRHINAPRVRFDLRGRAAGKADLDKWDIRINSDLLTRYPLEIIQQTVPHEVAHLIAAAWHGRFAIKAHGPEWRNVMRLFGKAPNRLHTMVTLPARTTRTFPTKCECADPVPITAVRYNRLVSGKRTYSCRLCGARIRPATPSDT